MAIIHLDQHRLVRGWRRDLHLFTTRLIKHVVEGRHGRRARQPRRCLVWFVAGGRRKCEHRHVLVKAELGRRLRQDAGKLLSSFDLQFTRDQPLHAECRRDPRAAGDIAAARVDLQRQVQPRAFGGRESHSRHEFGRQAFEGVRRIRENLLVNDHAAKAHPF